MTAATASRPPIGLSTKLLYGLGAAASAIKQRGLSTFLLIFYNQVVGLPPQMVSTAIMIALIFDAFVDPLVGQISDNFRSPLGRRHPFMYFAALPVAVAFFLIWNPPEGWEQAQIFAYMLTCLLTIRLFDTFFELPSSALVAELATEYDDRTKLIAMRSFFGVVGGLGMTLLAYQVFMREDAAGGGGVIERGGYFGYSLTAAMIIFLIIILSSAGTHQQIPYLRQPPTRKVTFTGMAREVAATLNNRGFVALTISGMFMSISLGLKGALELYFSLYFWGLNQGQLSLLTIAGVIASIAGVSLAPKVAARFGKRDGAIMMFAGAVIALVTPISLRLVHLMPPNGSDLLFGILFVDVILNGAMAMMTGVMLSSMIADVVEDAEVRTGRRSEGLLFSADNLFKKIVSGMGVFVSGALLAFVHFPHKAKRGEVDPELLRNLALAYLPTLVFFYAIAIGCLFLYRIDKAKHEDNLRILAETAAAAEPEAQVTTAPEAASGPLRHATPKA
jgi:GPH family glycoside/pentoside/hexuronide:cation symporter